MRKSKVKNVLLAVTLTGVLLLAACGKAESSSASGGTGSSASDPQEAACTVTFYDSDGITVLSTEKVKAGDPVSTYTPEKEGMVFMGWFATPTLSHAFDFSKPVTADTGVYAGFVEEKEDTRSFAIVGSGTSPVLVTSSWGTVINEEHHLAKEADKNVYSITLDLYEGDEFQFAINTAWNNQRGAGYMKTTTQDGAEYLAVSGGNYQAGEARKSNIKCLVNGNYTITLTTYPGSDIYDTEDEHYTEANKENFNYNPYDTLTWVYNGECKESASDTVTTYYIKSSVSTGWNDVYEDKYKFTEANGLHTLTIELAEGEEFLFTSRVKAGDTENVGNEYVRYTNVKDSASLGFVDGSESANLIAKAAGVYTFTYDPGTAELTVAFEAK